jgi:signal transduction histidine kinase
LLVGILALGSKAGDAPYTTQDLNVLSTLADQTAVALQNARLVSDLKQLNAEMTLLNDELIRTNRRLEKLDEAKTHFIQIASHELRTPLTQVRGYADIMADAVQTSTPTPAQMAQISQGISRATEAGRDYQRDADVSRLTPKADLSNAAQSRRSFAWRQRTIRRAQDTQTDLDRG